ncbi:hypothetical protein JCM10213_005419 [Rhodosporidiobolus nylandii]
MPPLPPPPRASAASPSPFAPPSPSSPSFSRPSSPSNLLGASTARSRKGETLNLGAVMSDLSVLTSARGRGLLSDDGGREGVFSPAPPPADAYAPQPPSLSLAQLRSGELSAEDVSERRQAVQLAEEWVKATGAVLERARGELEGGGEKVRRAERVEDEAGRIAEGLRA